jgi:hypothetical protein
VFVNDLFYGIAFEHWVSNPGRYHAVDLVHDAELGLHFLRHQASSWPRTAALRYTYDPGSGWNFGAFPYPANSNGVSEAE